VEWYKRFDLYRTRGVERLIGKVPEARRREMSKSFHSLNRNKVGVTLDLKNAEHRDALLELVGTSDVLIENFTHGTMDRLGLGFDELAKANPAIVVVSLSGFGDGSRLSEMRAYGLVLSSLAGIEGQVLDPSTGEFLGSPTFVASDPNAAVHGLLATVAGILDARRTGTACHIELSQLEAAAAGGHDDEELLGDLAHDVGLDGTPGSPDVRVIPTGDAHHLCVTVPAAVTDADWRRSVEAVATLDIAAAFAILEGIGCDAVQVLEDPAEFGTGAEAEGTLLAAEHPVTGPENLVAAPWWIDGARPPLRKTAPTLGEGNAYVLGELLGWPPDAYTGLEASIVDRDRASG
jgi:crotonobetainyl-CoA:carnitine CoA-transferase CaiB-like acyl-CoA transferase